MKFGLCIEKRQDVYELEEKQWNYDIGVEPKLIQIK